MGAASKIKVEIIEEGFKKSLRFVKYHVMIFILCSCIFYFYIYI